MASKRPRNANGNVNQNPKPPKLSILSIRTPKFILPDKLKEDVEYISKKKHDGRFYIKELEYKYTVSAKILKELQDKDNVDDYLPLLLTQEIQENVYGYSIIQTFANLGKDLLKISIEDYKMYRETIHTTLDEAITFLHDNDVIHCDIKPENIIWDPIAKRSKLIDLDSLAYKDPTLMFESLTITRSNPVPLDEDLDNYAAEVTKQGLDIFHLGKKAALEKWNNKIDKKAYLWIRKEGGARGRRLRSTRTTKRRSYKKNGRLRAGQPRRRNYTRHVARQL